MLKSLWRSYLWVAVCACLVTCSKAVCDADLLASSDRPTYPVVLIPVSGQPAGLAGSVLDAQLNRTKTISWFCTKRSNWRVVYLSFREILDPECLCDELLVFYDAETQTYHNQEGVRIRPHDFGGLTGVAALDPSTPELTATYLPLIKALQAAGYRERETLWGAPYDWRLAADGLMAQGVADDMQSLIELAYATAGHQKVVLVTHSMGNIVTSYFMNKWGKAWVQKHVKHMFAVSGPWAGAVDALKGPISGDNFDLHFPHSLLHKVQGTSPSAPWLFPSKSVWPKDKVLVSTRTATYTASDLEELLQDVGLEQLSEMFPQLQELHVGQLDAGFVPVPMTCAWGYGVSTAEAYHYDVDDLVAAGAPEPATVFSEDGDGTVNLRSLKACMQAGTPGKTSELAVEGGSHLGILSKSELIKGLAQVLELSDARAEALVRGSHQTVQRICKAQHTQSWWSKLHMPGARLQSVPHSALAHCS